MVNSLFEETLRVEERTIQKVTYRAFAAFALGTIGGEQARDALERAHGTEKDPGIMKEIELQLTVVGRLRPR